MSTIRYYFYALKSRTFSVPIRAYFSSSSAGSVGHRRCVFPDDGDEEESAVYKHAMKFQKPSVMKWSKRLEKLENLVSFIGTVLWPVKVFVHGIASTEIVVNTSRDSTSSFRITLNMKGETASVCLQHLKPNDYIYVSGQLEQFVDGKSVKRYKVMVNELNYVAKCGDVLESHKSSQSEFSGETPLEKYKTRLHLWQLFFANPQEWWDNRNDKRNPKSPDFKHKDTGEVLWLSPNDPPWIAAQLKLQDSRMLQYRHMRSHYSDTRPDLSKYLPDDSI